MTNEQKEESLCGRVVNIKEEMLDTEFEEKIGLITGNTKLEPLNISNKNIHSGGEFNGILSQDNLSLSPENDTRRDDKKNIEPAKSSNEILTELFKVFNAAPPDELLDDKSLIKKVKKHKKVKKKKNKKYRDDDDSNDNIDEREFDTCSEQDIDSDKQKYKKKKKHKHKHKQKTVSKIREKLKESRSQVKNIKIKSKPSDNDRAVINMVCDKNNDINKLPKPRISNSPMSKSLKLESECRVAFKKHKRQLDKDFKELPKNKHKPSEKHSDFIHNSDKERSFSEPTEYNSKVISSEQGITIKSERSEKAQLSNKKSESDDDISDITLSDEESYLKSKECIRDSSSIGYRKDRSYNSFYAGVERTHSRNRTRSSTHRGRDYSRSSRHRYRDRSSRDYNRHRDRGQERGNVYSRSSLHYERHARSRSRLHSRSRTRSRSRCRSRDLGIDKKRLLEIARKNAISMFKRGNLPGCDNMSQEIKDKVLLKMRYGGRTVEDLTKFCKKISKGEELSDLSSDEESDVDKGGNVKPFHHPFQLKDREPIVMHIRNSKPIVPTIKNSEHTKAITMQFPVSSGEQHRLTEAWVPVESKNNIKALTSLPSASHMPTVVKNLIPKNVLGKSLPTQKEQEPAFNPVSQTSISPPPLPPSAIPLPNEINGNVTHACKASLSSTTTSMIVTEVSRDAHNNFTPDVPIPSSSSVLVFPSGDQQLDVSTIISKRLSAMRRLQENPSDSEALKQMCNSQKEMTCWASSKYLPGQFTGSTGANILKPSELNSGPQVWARKNQLTSSKPVTGGMGMQLLQKMGWKPGEGLGPEKKGVLQPLLLDVKLDKRGLVAQDDVSTVVTRKPNIPKKPKIASTSLNIQDKHPVCLLNELTSKRKWTPPMYTLTYENGPSHSRMFLFSVAINGQTFTPNRASNTKKEAKLLAAKNCLQQIGILPPD